MKRIIAILALFFALPIVSFAADGTFLIPSWQNPSPSASYLFSNHVVINGTWQLPPDWAANIYVYTDASVDPMSGALLTAGTQRSDVSTGQPYYSISNAGNTASSSGTFSFDIGPQPSGAHNVYIKFVGGQQCAVNANLNSTYGTNYTPTCTITADNAAFNLMWPARNFTVQLPPYPRIVITPAAPLNFSGVVFGTTMTLPFYVSNTGAQTLTGTVSGLSAPFSCSVCSYTVNPGATSTINITFAPPAPLTSYSQNIQFSCSGSSLGCDGLPFGTPEIINAQLTGDSVINATAPALSVTPASKNYGTVNLGVNIPDVAFVVKNTGGGILNGGVTFSSGEYTCSGVCTYSLFAGQQTTIYAHYVPVAIGTHTDSAVFTGGVGQTVPLLSFVNDLPILSVYSSTINFTPTVPVPVGQCKDVTEYVRNSGSATLSGNVTNLYTTAVLSEQHPGFSCVGSGCSYSNLINNGGWYPMTLRFCPIDGLATSTTVTFTNIDNPPAGGTATIFGQGTTTPIGGFSANATLAFGNVLVGATKYGTTTIANTGAGILSGSVGVLPLGYTCVNNCTYNVNSGTSVGIGIMFQPTAVQAYNGTASLSGVGTLTLTGSGVFPNFEMSYSGWPLSGICPGSTCLPPSPKTYDVGTTTYGGALSAQNKTFYLWIQNTGTGANISYSFPDATHFKCLGGVYGKPCAGSLAPYGSAGSSWYEQMKYEFQPDAASDFSEPIVVNYDYGDGIPRQVTLNLVGHSVNAPYLSVSPLATIPLGAVSVGNTATATFSVMNLGIGALNGVLSSVLSSEDLNGLWSFDDAHTDWTSSTAFDSSGWSNDGSFGPSRVQGQFGEAVRFNTFGGLYTSGLSNMPSGNTPHSIAAWIKIDALPSYRAWIALLGNEGNGSDHWLLSSNGTAQFGVWGYPSQQVQPILPIGQWAHVVTTYDGATLSLYVNGVLTQSTPAAFNIVGLGGIAPLSLGVVHQNETPFNGELDDVYVYKRALTPLEVTQLYTNAGAPAGNIVGHWTLDDADMSWTGRDVVDTSGSDNNLKITGPSRTSGKIGEGARFSSSYSYLGGDVSTKTFYSNPAVFTVSTWFRTSVASGHKMIGFETAQTGSSGSYDRHLYMGTDGRVRFGIYDGSARTIASLSTLNDDNWHLAVGTRAADGTMSLYIDGALQGTLAVPSPWAFGGYWRIGGYKLTNWPLATDGYFSGRLDEPRVYGHALTATDVSALYSAGLSGTTAMYSGSSVFQCVSGCTFSNLLNGQSQLVKIEFTPTDALTYTGLPLFTSDGGNVGYPSAPYPAITGTGTLDPIISVTPLNVGFPDTNQGLASQETITISNTGLGNLSGSISPVQSSGLDFYCKSGCNFNVLAGSSTTAVIEFAPQNTGALTGTITVNSNGVNYPVSSGQRGRELVNVYGNGTFAPIIDIRGGDTNYGPVVIGKHKDRAFTIQNTGTVDLGSGTFVVTGDFACIDPLTNAPGTCPYNITAGASVNVIIRFSPTTVGAKTGAVYLSGVPLARFFVSGLGVSPSVKFIEQ